MDDFKIGDDFENNGKQNKIDRKIAIIIVIVVSIFFGLLVFFISNAIIGKNEKEPPKVDTQVNLDDENVKILYSYVAYKDNGYGNDKFLKEKSVTSNSFTNEDKLFYALQFVDPNDLVYDGQKTDQGQKIYNLSITKIKTYLQRFFGSDNSISPVDEFEYKFDFSINGLSLAKLTYSEEEQDYKVVFMKEEEKTEELVRPYYTKLSSATKKADGTLILNEKVIYTTFVNENDVYKINIYKDFEHTTLLEMLQNIKKEDLIAKPISLEKYEDKSATISYIFKINSINRNYYFDSSSITY
ncbi:MAG: hypothetical protein IKE63_00715 [Bacilli bacterium]|nr:hypothetical protein [Bacilli bacterium]